MPRPTPADSVMPIDWSTRPSSSIATHRLVKSPPSASSSEPPNSSGTTRPNRPSSPILRHEVGREVVVAVPLRDVRARPSARRTRGRPCGSPRGPCSARTSAPLRAGGPGPGSRGAAYGHVLDVDVNVKQYCAVCQPRPSSRSSAAPAAGATASAAAPGRSREIADEFGVTHRTVRHYEELGLISPERRGTTRVYHRRDRTRLEPHPARQAARVPARGDPHDHRPLRRPAGPAQPARVRPRPDRRTARRPRAAPARPRRTPCPSSASSSAAAARTSAAWADPRSPRARSPRPRAPFA